MAAERCDHALSLPLPTRQYELRNAGRLVARIDFAYVAQRVPPEVDGFRFHSNRAPWYRDRDRLNELSLLGWRFLLGTSLF